MDQHATDLLTDWSALRAGIPPVWARYTDLVVERASGSWIETVRSCSASARGSEPAATIGQWRNRYGLLTTTS